MRFNQASKSAKRKSFTLLFSLALILLFTVGGTIAYIVTSTDNVTNTFQPSQVSCAVDETFTDGVKSNVSIKNTSDIPAYIRAHIIVTWKDKDGNIYGGAAPVLDTDYSLTIKNGTKWVKYDTDGYYYFTEPVAVGDKTGVLIEECKYLGNAPSGYSLSVEIIADAIQSEPPNAVGEAWGVAFGNGGVVPYTTPPGN